MPAILIALLVCLRVNYAFGDRQNYTNGCAYFGKQEDIVARYDQDHMIAPFVNCTALKLATINYAMFNENIRSLGLSRNQLTTFNISNIARFSNLATVDLGHNQISNVSVSANTISCSISTIYLGFNSLKEIPTDLLKTCNRLTSFNIFGNSISHIKESDFIGASSLRFLTLGGNPIKTISKTTFSHNALYSLDMSDCGLTTVPLTIKNQKKMVVVNLGHNDITSIDEDAFTNCTGLRFLSLQSNKISKIHAKAFDGTVKLSSIALSDNRIETIPEGIFSNMADENTGMFVEMYENPIRCDCKLQWLPLWLESHEVRYEFDFTCAQPARNKGKHFHDIAATDLTCLPDDKDWIESDHTADCGKESPEKPSSPDETEESTNCPEQCECYHSNGTKYHSVGEQESISRKQRRWRNFDQFPFVDCVNAGLTKFPYGIRQDVRHIRIIGSSIKSLSIAKLKSFQSLGFLEIEGCGLENIFADASTKLPKLERLSLQNNNLKTITKDALISFQNLSVLSISHNKLGKIPKDLFVYNRKLKEIAIGPNPVNQFDDRCLDGLDLTDLSLNKMNLTVVPTITATKLEYLGLSDNAITRISNGSFTGVPNVTTIVLANNQIARLDVKAFKGCTRLDSLDLSENNITTLPRGVFDDISRDRVTIELWRNRFYCDCKLKWFKEWIDELTMEDPETDIRFSCLKPWSIHAKTVDVLRPEDFACKSTDTRPDPKEDVAKVDDEFYLHNHGPCYTGGNIALTVFLTMFFTIVSAFVIRLLCRYRNRNKRYRHPEDRSPLELDM